MRRVMLFAFLALALPTAALASSIDFTTGTFRNGTISRNTTGGFTPGNFRVDVVGATNIIRLSTAVLSPGCSGSVGTCTFTSGTVTVENLSSTTLFTDSLVNGIITKTSNSAIITASLAPNSMGIGPAGGIVRFVVQFSSAGPPFSTDLTGATARVAAIPEPGTLGLLGTGLIGLAGAARRKLNL